MRGAGMKSSLIALFGEAEKGDLTTLYLCRSVQDLYTFFGQPPKDSAGLHFAVQTLLFGKEILYFRVRQEGFSLDDYLKGLHLLEDYPRYLPLLEALFLPSVGSKRVIEEGVKVCQQHHSLLLMSAPDFYDYMTEAA